MERRLRLTSRCHLRSRLRGAGSLAGLLSKAVALNEKNVNRAGFAIRSLSDNAKERAARANHIPGDLGLRANWRLFDFTDLVEWQLFAGSHDGAYRSDALVVIGFYKHRAIICLSKLPEDLACAASGILAAFLRFLFGRGGWVA